MSSKREPLPSFSPDLMALMASPPPARSRSFRVDVGGSRGSSQPLTPVSPPPPYSPSASSLGARYTGSAGGVDPLMQYINSTLAPSVVSRSGSDLASWELNFRDLQIEHPVGEGSWGRVYKAKWHETPVAVKVLLDTAAAGPGGTGGSTRGASMVPATDPVLGRLQQEAGLISSLRHPNIVQASKQYK